MTVKRTLITLLVLSVIALMLPGIAMANAGTGQGITVGKEGPLQMTINLINGDPAADWDLVPLNQPVSQLGITSNNYDEFLSELVKLYDPDGGSDWHSLFLASSWDANGGWNSNIQFMVGSQLYDARLDDWLDDGFIFLGIEVPDYYEYLSQMSYSQVSGLSIERILTLGD